MVICRAKAFVEEKKYQITRTVRQAEIEEDSVINGQVWDLSLGVVLKFGHRNA